MIPAPKSIVHSTRTRIVLAPGTSRVRMSP